jgi:hypothetical protein
MKKSPLVLPIGSNFSEGVDLRDEATNFASKRGGRFAGQTGQMNHKNCIELQKLNRGACGLQSLYLWA